ncbi:MAG: hypothetical protein LYZ70_07860 [Nitrososphaerales archaeon]|nr:hypothetical protein [Nitrososphaerales archaeon]
MALTLTLAAAAGHLLVWYAMPTVDVTPGTPLYKAVVGTHPLVFLVIGLLFVVGAMGIILDRPLVSRLLVLYTFIVILVYVATRSGIGGNRLIEPLGLLSTADEVLLMLVTIHLSRSSGRERTKPLSRFNERKNSGVLQP